MLYLRVTVCDRGWSIERNSTTLPLYLGPIWVAQNPQLFKLKSKLKPVTSTNLIFGQKWPRMLYTLRVVWTYHDQWESEGLDAEVLPVPVVRTSVENCKINKHVFMTLVTGQPKSTTWVGIQDRKMTEVLPGPHGMRTGVENQLILKTCLHCTYHKVVIVISKLTWGVIVCRFISANQKITFHYFGESSELEDMTTKSGWSTPDGTRHLELVGEDKL